MAIALDHEVKVEIVTPQHVARRIRRTVGAAAEIDRDRSCIEKGE
jgi:hypothetical protein